MFIPHHVCLWEYMFPHHYHFEVAPKLDLLNLLVKTRLVITDSGGIQEECSFFNKKCLVCRKVTERPESVNLTSFLIDEPKDLASIFNCHINNYNVNIESPYGDGKSSIKICDILNKLIK